MKTENLYKIVPAVFSILVLCFAVTSFALGWTEPSASPPNNNVDAPVNVGALVQYKSGSLGIGGAFVAYSNAVIGDLSSPSAFPELQVNGDIFLNGGRFGIGTGSPIDLIHLVNSGGGNQVGILFQDPTASKYGARIYFDDANNNFRIVTKNDGVESWGISIARNNGNVGIGTGSPTSFFGAKLDVDGAVQWGAQTYRGFLLSDQGASLELGGSGTPYIDISNDDSQSTINDYDIRLMLTGDDTLTVYGGDICHGSSGNCLGSNSAKAWVVFDGDTPPYPIRDGSNVSSVSYLGGGTYRVDWATPFADANYAPIITTSGGPVRILEVNPAFLRFQVFSISSSPAAATPDYISVLVMDS